MFQVRHSPGFLKTMLSPLERRFWSNFIFFICSAHCALLGTNDSFTHATAHAMATATARSGRTIARKLTPLARIATISEWRQKFHMVYSVASISAAGAM